MPGRRRFLLISAAACAGMLLPGAGRAAAEHRWTGRALGAPGQIRLVHGSHRHVQRVFASCRAEIVRLERLFSLHRPDSALVRLNRDGRLDSPDPDLVSLLDQAQALSALTGGAFDVTVQPLWALYAAHFARPGVNAPPPAAEIARGLGRVGYQRISAGRRHIALPPGSALTFNGIAQGFITDRITELLRDAGFDHVLVELGEARALGRHASGREWRLGVVDPNAPWRLAGHVALRERALASSGGYGTPLSPDGRYHHLFDPGTGGCATAQAGVSVLAPRAVLADALATAFAVLPHERSLKVAAQMPEIAVRLTAAEGRVHQLRWPVA